MTDADQSPPRGGAGDQDGADRDADLEQWGRYAKPLGVFDESRLNEFLNITVARGEAVDALTVLCREARDERDRYLQSAEQQTAWGQHAIVPVHETRPDNDGGGLLGRALRGG